MLKYEPTQKELFEEYFKIRARVKPGITGMAQAYGRSSLTTKKATELDVYYVEHFSLWLDIKIIFKTIHTVLFQKGVNWKIHVDTKWGTIKWRKKSCFF